MLVKKHDLTLVSSRLVQEKKNRHQNLQCLTALQNKVQEFLKDREQEATLTLIFHRGVKSGTSKLSCIHFIMIH